MWRAVVAMIVLQHPSFEALVRDLRRNPVRVDIRPSDARPGPGMVEAAVDDGFGGGFRPWPR